MRSRPYRDRKLAFRTYVPKEAVKRGEWPPGARQSGVSAVMGPESNIPKTLEVVASNWWAIRASGSRAPGVELSRSGDAIRKFEITCGCHECAREHECMGAASQARTGPRAGRRTGARRTSSSSSIHFVEPRRHCISIKKSNAHTTSFRRGDLFRLGEDQHRN